jgi:hypothetical protein
MMAPIIDRLTFLVTGKLPEMNGLQAQIDRAITALMNTPLLAAVGERVTHIPLYVLAALAILVTVYLVGSATTYLQSRLMLAVSLLTLIICMTVRVLILLMIILLSQI